MADRTGQDEAAKRRYWAERLDEAHAFMMRVAEYPAAECGERLVSLVEAAREAGVEVAFSQRPHVYGWPRIYVLREGQIAGFVEAARRFNRRGWVIRVEDGYRNRAMQKAIGLQPSVFDAVLGRVIWELDGRRPEPGFFFKRLLPMVAQIPSTGMHMSGSAMDISVLKRGSGAEVDRGGPYLEFSERTPMDSPFVGPLARRNRQTITAMFRESGFVEYPYEFWHYSSGDAGGELHRGEGRPARYGAVDFDAATGRVTPLEGRQERLNSLEEIMAQIEAAIERNLGAGAPA